MDFLCSIGIKTVFVIVIIYLILVLNKIIYKTKLYRMDIATLKQSKKNIIAGTTAKMIKNGSIRYAPQIADGEIKAAEKKEDEKILRRKLKYRRDMINSLITAITQLFHK